MPTQETGTKDDIVKVVTVDSMTGQIVNNIERSIDRHSPTADSVDGGSYTPMGTSDFKSVDLQAAIDNLQSVQSSVAGAGNILVSGLSNNLPNISYVTLAGGSEPVTTLSPVQNATVVASNSGTQVFKLEARTLQEAEKILGKRHNSSTQAPIVNKVIITKNPSSSQPQAVPVQLSQVAGQTLSVSQTGPGINVLPHLLTSAPKTPTKTITISQHGIVSPLKGVSIGQVVGSPNAKLPISPARTPTKITMIKSPQRIAPAPGFTVLNNSASTNVTQQTITMSPSKVIRQPGTVHLLQKPLQPNSNPAVMAIPKSSTAPPMVRHVTMPLGSNLQQIHVPGNKFHYIRLAAPPSSVVGKSQVITKPGGVPVSTMVAGQSAPQLKIAAGPQLVPQTKSSGTNTVQRILLPAMPNQVQIRPAPAVPPSQLIQTGLPAGSGTLGQPGGATLIPTGNNAQGVQGFALVPASYLSQIQQQMHATTTITTAKPAAPPPVPAQARLDYVPIASSNPAVSDRTQRGGNVNGSVLEASGTRPRKPCNCTKSQCLKLYCDCFANGEFCYNCNCMHCANNLEHEEERSRAIKSCLERNPLAFHPKIGKGRQGEKDRRHNKGCNCKRSGCLKNYCECYEAKIMCGASCKCIGCKNFEESPERKTLMHLADAAEVRVLQQTAAKTKLSSQISDVPSRPPGTSATGERLPFSFVTGEVAEATCACLMAQAEEADRQRMPPVVQERMVIEEFGRCLQQIIESASRTKAPDPDETT